MFYLPVIWKVKWRWYSNFHLLKKCLCHNLPTKPLPAVVGSCSHTWAGTWQWSCCQHSTHGLSQASRHHLHVFHPEKLSLNTPVIPAVSNIVNAIINIINLCSLCNWWSVQANAEHFWKAGFALWPAEAGPLQLTLLQKQLHSSAAQCLVTDSTSSWKTTVAMISTARSKLVFTESQN